MKRKHTVLWIALVISGFLVAAAGAYLKYQVLRPVGLLQDESIIAVPFVLMRDTGVREIMLSYYREPSGAAQPEETTIAPTTVPPTTQPPTEAPTEPPTEAPTEPPATQQPTEPPAAEVPTQPPLPEPEPPSVDVSWFDDALFIGDSRIVGQRNNSRLGKADYFCDVGMTVYNVTERAVKDDGFAETTLLPLLAARKYGKIIISLGLNECGLPLDSLIGKYRELITTVRQAQPDAVIVLNSIMTLGRWKASSESYFALSNIYSINDAIKGLAESEGVFYIDINPYIADSEGYLPDELSGDGCHLYMTSDPIWARWLCQQMALLDA